MILPVFSIIVPVYNVSLYLRNCLDTILEQSFTDFEVILIDDGSTDESGQICDLYCQKDPRFKVIHQYNQGSSAARNRGLRVCQGRIICFIDSDDWVAPQFLSNFHKTIIEKDSDVVISAFYFNKGSIESYHPNEPSRLDGKTIITESLDGHIHSGLVFKAIKRDLIFNNNLLFPEHNYFEDMYFNCALMHYAKKINYSPAATYHYRYNPSSQTNDSDSGKRLNRYFEFCENMKDLFDDYKMWEEPDFRGALYKRINEQKILLLAGYYNKQVHKGLKHSFKESANYFPIKYIPDFFVFLSLKISRRWPIAILHGLLNIKKKIIKKTKAFSFPSPA